MAVRWFRTTDEVLLLDKVYVGEVVPRTVVFFSSGASIAADQEVPFGDPETYQYSELVSHQMLPICFYDHPTLGTRTLYIMAEWTDPKSPHCKMVEIKK